MAFRFLTAAAGIRACAIERSDLTPSHRWVDHLATVSNGALISDGMALFVIWDVSIRY